MVKSVEHLSSTSENYSVPHLIYDPDTFDIIEVNKEAIEIYGFSRSKFTSLSIQDLQSPEGIPELYNHLSDIAFEKKLINIGDFRHRNKGGDAIHIQAYTQIYDYQESKMGVLYIHHLNQDVRPPHKLEQDYYNRQRQLYHNPLAMMRLNQNFEIIEWSDRAEEITGYNRTKVVGHSIFDLNLFVKGKSEKIERHLESFRNDKSRDHFEAIIQLKNGDLMHVMIHASALHDKNGDLKSILAFIQNIDVRKEYLQHLEEREQRYHRLFEHASDAIVLLDDSTIIGCNQKLVDLLEINDKEELIGQSILQFSSKRFYEGKDQDMVMESSINKAKGGDSQIFKWHFLTSQGNKKFVEISMQKLIFEDGEYLEAIIRDLTEREKAQYELSKEQGRLKNAQKLANMGWWHYEIQEDSLTLSENLLDILNLNEKNFDFNLESFKQIVHVDDRGKVDSIINKAEESFGATDHFLRINKSGSEDIIYTNGRATTEFDHNNKAVALSGMLQDITDYRKGQKELTRQKELFKSLFLDSPVAIAMINTDGKVSKVNNSFEDLFGYTEKELIGKDLLDFQLPDDRQEKVADFYDALFEGTPSPQYIQDRRLTKHGDEKHLIIASVPVPINGKPIAAFDIYTDITKLRETEGKLKESLQEKEVLLSEIHHRVKNNLAIISGLLELEAMECEENSTIYNVLTESKMRIHSMASIHEQLYESNDFSNISIGTYISDLVDSISDAFNHQDKDININVHTEDILLNINQALPCALIINELVTHAYQHAYEGNKYGDLDITFSQDNDIITLVIDDGGPGLPDDFEKMVEESLGHRLVQQLVKQINGKIEVDNNKTGTRYTITFQKERKRGSAASQVLVDRN